VTEGEGISRNILNSGYCAQAIEVRQISQSHGQARRDSAGLHLRLANGTTLNVVDDTADTAGAWPVWFSFLGTSSGIGYYVLWAQHTEGYAIRLISTRTGWSTVVHDLPIVSPDRRRFVTATQIMVRYNPERIAVWRVEGDTLRHEWGLETMDWVPDRVHWLSSRSFEFDRMSPVIAALVREATDTAELDATGTWVSRVER